MASLSRAQPAGGADAGVNGANEKKARFPSHPLGPLSTDEITQSSRLIAQSWPQDTLFLFKSVKLREPAKKELAPYLEDERAGRDLTPIDRRSDVLYYIRNTVRFPPNDPRISKICSNVLKIA